MIAAIIWTLLAWNILRRLRSFRYLRLIEEAIPVDLPAIAIFLRLSPLYALTVPAGISAYAAIATSSVWHHHRGRILWKGRILDSKDALADRDQRVSRKS